MGKAIVVEGPDGSGKSTLCDILSDGFKLGIQRSEGPPKGPGEMSARVKGYLEFHRSPIIYDRHPVVSQPIYNRGRDNPQHIEPELVRRFYEGIPKYFFIYCASRYEHVQNEHDTPEHLALIDRQQHQIEEDYTRWAVDRAHYIYRGHEEIGPLFHAVKGYLNA